MIDDCAETPLDNLLVNSDEVDNITALLFNSDEVDNIIALRPLYVHFVFI